MGLDHKNVMQERTTSPVQTTSWWSQESQETPRERQNEARASGLTSLALRHGSIGEILFPCQQPSQQVLFIVLEFLILGW